MERYLTLASHFKRRFGERVQKIPLDAGFTCPNRDGTLSRHGCAFCNPRGSGTGLGHLSLADQWGLWRTRLAKKYKARLFMAYLQSFSNTHGPIARLRQVISQITALPGLAGLAVGTRPDCLDAEKIACLAGAGVPENWLELGLQSANDDTLARINRGHDAACFARAAQAAAKAGLSVCAHIIHGLPGETDQDFLDTVAFLNNLPISGVKFHNIYISDQTALARDLANGRYTPPTREAYLSALARAIESLRPDIIVQRVTGDPAPGELLAPNWAADKNTTLKMLAALLNETDAWQGKRLGAPSRQQPQSLMEQGG